MAEDIRDIQATLVVDTNKDTYSIEASGDSVVETLDNLRDLAEARGFITVTHLSHHVVLKNGRDDIVCACGEHFRSSANNVYSIQTTNLDAIQKWVIHYREMENK